MDVIFDWNLGIMIYNGHITLQLCGFLFAEVGVVSERLRDFLLSKGFTMGKVDTTLFIKKIGKDLFVLQIYIDDIIFGSTNQDFCDEFRKMMANEFEMSMIGELSCFLGL